MIGWAGKSASGLLIFGMIGGEQDGTRELLAVLAYHSIGNMQM